MGKNKKHRRRAQRQGLSAYERIQWARLQWIDNPDIPIQGERGMISMMKDHFDVAASYSVLSNTREGALREREVRMVKAKAKHAAVRVASIHPIQKSDTPSSVIATADSPPPALPILKPSLEPMPGRAETVEPAKPSIVPRKKKRTKRADVQEREIFALHQLRNRPHMPLKGPDGLNELIRSRFGIGMNHDALRTLKDQVQAELREPQTLKSIIGVMAKKEPSPPVVIPEPEPAPEPIPESKPVPMPEPVRRSFASSDVEADLRTATEIIKSSIPDIKEYILRVSADGKKTEVSFSRHVTGSFTIEED